LPLFLWSEAESVMVSAVVGRLRGVSSDPGTECAKFRTVCEFRVPERFPAQRPFVADISGAIGPESCVLDDDMVRVAIVRCAAARTYR